MKILPPLLLGVLCLVIPVFSEVQPANVSPEPAITSAASPTTARILGPIPDGTPRPPSPPKPEFTVPTKDILETTNHEQGGRTITIQRINPIALIPPPKPAPPSLDDIAFRERLAEVRAQHPQSQFVALGATVYRSKSSPPRTLVTYRPGGDAEPVTFWSAADFSLLAGIHNFAGSNGQTYSLFLMWSVVDLDRLGVSMETQGREYSAPKIPKFPDGDATFTITEGQAAAEFFVPIHALHQIYNSEYARLKAACESREQAQREREAYLKANPPLPKNITLNYWRTESPAPAKGGAK